MTTTTARTLRMQGRSAAIAPRRQQIGGLAAFYLALALLGAIPYFLLVVDYPGATTAADKVALVVANYAGMYTAYLATYVLFGLAVAVLALAMHDRLAAADSVLTRIATAVGLMWSFALVASGLLFTYGMTTVVDLHATDPAQAVLMWQAFEPAAMALGGAGGELLGGVWVLLLSLLARRAAALPKPVTWLGLVIGVTGLLSVVPPLHDAAIAFGLLQIAWFTCVGWILLRTHRRALND